MSEWTQTQVILCDAAGMTQAPCNQGQPLTREAYVQVPASELTFDYVRAGEVWAVAFTSVLFLYLISHGIGTVLAFFRRG